MNNIYLIILIFIVAVASITNMLMIFEINDKLYNMNEMLIEINETLKNNKHE
jgi:hypothetical protein